MRRVFTALVAILGIASLASEAASQCTMTHRAVDGVYLLCAVGGGEWEWTGPGGFTANTICVNVDVPGTYTVRVFDPFSGLWSAPCSFSFASVPLPPECSISGADSVCSGATTSWCGPSGNFSYDWSGPGGFSGNTACVDVSEPGDYWLTVTDNTNETAGLPCSRTLNAKECAAPPPPPPSGGCPSPARWWARSCDDHRAPLDAATFAHVAALVDERSGALAYGGTADGLCGLLRRRHDMSDAAVARRHYAAVLANLSAAELGVKASDGHAVGLEASATLNSIRDIPAGWTVGDWAASAEARMMALAGTPARSRAAHDECRRIARQARAINRLPGNCGTNLTALVDDDDDEFGVGGAFGAEEATVSVSGAPRRDPLSGDTRMSWTLLRSAEVELRVIDITGRSIRHLASGVYSAGVHQFTWDGRDDDGRSVRAGAYFVAGRVGDERTSQRLYILR